MVWKARPACSRGQRAGKRIHFKYEDVEAIREEAPSSAWSARNGTTRRLQIRDRVVTVQSKAVQYPYGEMRKLNVAEGRFFEESDFTEHRHVLIVGPTPPRKCLQPRSVGEFVTINGGSWK